MDLRYRMMWKDEQVSGFFFSRFFFKVRMVFVSLKFYFKIGKISGTVVNHDGKPLSDIKVKLVSTETGLETSHTKTDNKGAYEFVSVNPGSYEISFELPVFIESDGATCDVVAGGKIVIQPIKTRLSKNGNQKKKEEKYL